MDSQPGSEPIADKLRQWPPVEGRYAVGNRESPVAICTMASVDLKFPMDKVAIAGKCVTENLGIEKIVKNVVSNPNIRYIIVAGKESMGHWVDNALESLVENGVDPEMRIIGAKGGIPVLKNATMDEVERFRKQVSIVNMAGETDTGKIMERVDEYFGKPVQPIAGEAIQSSGPSRVAAKPHRISDWVQDPNGYFTVSVSHDRGEIEASHHEASGRVTGVFTGRNAEDLYHHVINAGLVTRLDHAAYLGRELAKAETALFNRADYEQDTGLVMASTRPALTQPRAIGQDSMEPTMDTDGKELVPLPTRGKLISVKKIEQTRETVLTYVVNDREFQVRNRQNEEEEHFKEFLKGCGMHRVF
jgi:tetrahydromethanopterin S-methyltransferase subunit A